MIFKPTEKELERYTFDICIFVDTNISDHIFGERTFANGYFSMIDCTNTAFKTVNV